MVGTVSSPMSDPTTYLDYSDIVKLINAAGKLRDRVAISLMYYCGLRVGEVVKLKKRHIVFSKENPKESYLVVEVTKKGRKGSKSEGKKRTYRDLIYIPTVIQPPLKEYLLTVNLDDSYIFQSPYMPGCPITVRWAQLMLDKVASKASTMYDKGGKKIHPHTLRHSLAISLIKKGFKLPKIQAVLRHRSLSSTSYYLIFSQKEIAEDFHAVFEELHNEEINRRRAEENTT